MKKVAFIAITDQAIEKALVLQKQFPKSVVVTTRVSENENVSTVEAIDSYLENNFNKLDGICFVSALGICVRMIAPFIQDKNTDPAVICVDDQGTFVQSVISGHVGGANDFALKVSQLLGAQAVISTSSDQQNIWALDTLGSQYDWEVLSNEKLNHVISLFVNRKKTALLLDVKDKGTVFLEKTLPKHVEVFYDVADLKESDFELIITVTYKKYAFATPYITYVPKVLSVGSGCSKSLNPVLFDAQLKTRISEEGLLFEAIKNFGSCLLYTSPSPRDS